MTARDRNARNLAEVLDFTKHEKPVELPPFDPGLPRQCSASDLSARIADGGP